MKKITLALTTTMLIFTACSNQEQVRHINKQMCDENQIKKETVHRKRVPKPPKKHVTLKKVEDENFSADYMYPTTKKSNTKEKVELSKNIETNQTKEEVVVLTKSSAMTKEECISMVGQEKFDSYTEMYGNIGSTLKKCKMLKEL